jgi:NAD+ synthase (glutamine-hydrolysing)
MRLALAQLNPLVGDLEGNGRRIEQAGLEAAAEGADLLLTPELSLWGYPPRDLLLRSALLERQQRELERLANSLPSELAVLVGMAEPIDTATSPRLYNALALLEGGQWLVVARKQLLPSYDVFDERRYFLPGERTGLLELERQGRRWRLGLTICEDLWVEEELQGHRLAGADPIAQLESLNIDLLLNLSASPFGQGKLALRQRLAARAAARLGCPVVYVNQVGGTDDLVFDGASFVVDKAGNRLCQMRCAEEQLAVWEAQPKASGPVEPTPDDATPDPSEQLPLQDARLLINQPSAEEQLLRILVLGVRDYAHKCGFSGALLGLSGGIDSALVAVIACAALGPENVKALRMPSPWSSTGSLDDAQTLADRLQLDLQTVPIEDLMHSFDRALTPALGAAPTGVTAENLQSRIRGTLLMALANQQVKLLLSTGNKSELAVGYCTLYGDMNGGLAVIGDLYKSTVFSLCDWIDSPASAECRRELQLPAEGELIGAEIRTKPPSAELRPEQRDSDSLPDYAVLDPMLKALIEALATPEQLIAAGGGDPALIQRIHSLLMRAEFKRRQAAPALKVSSRAFGGGWRMPIAAKQPGPPPVSRETTN